MKVFGAGALLLLVGCAAAPPPAPLVERKPGLTILIRNPFDCDVGTAMQCTQTAGLDYECVCGRVAANKAQAPSLRR